MVVLSRTSPKMLNNFIGFEDGGEKPRDPVGDATRDRRPPNWQPGGVSQSRDRTPKWRSSAEVLHYWCVESGFGFLTLN